MTPFKGRKVDYSKPVQVYRNLNGELWNRWSIRQGGLVVAHAEELQLSGVRFKVSHSGWARMIESGRRNVHAIAVGDLIKKPMPFWAGNYRTPVKYDRQSGHFRDDCDNRVERAWKAHFGFKLRVDNPSAES